MTGAARMQSADSYAQMADRALGDERPIDALALAVLCLAAVHRESVAPWPPTPILPDVPKRTKEW